MGAYAKRLPAWQRKDVVSLVGSDFARSVRPNYSNPFLLLLYSSRGQVRMRSWSHCPVCGSGAHKNLWIHRPGRSISGRVVVCTGCKTLFKIPDDLTNGVAKYYTEGRYTSAYAIHDGENHAVAMAELREVLKHMLATFGPRRGKLLDLGCGIGRFMEMAQSAGFEVAGIEIDADAAMTAKARTGAAVWVQDLDIDPLPIENCEAITMLDLIEHVQDPVALLSRAHDRLSNGGKIVVFTPNHNSLIVKVGRALESATSGRVRHPVDNIFDCVHVTFFTVDSLALALKKAGFAVEATNFVPYRPERRGEARGLSALGLRAIETVSHHVSNGPFRILMVGAKG